MKRGGRALRNQLCIRGVMGKHCGCTSWSTAKRTQSPRPSPVMECCADTQQVMVRFVEGRPVSSVTIEFLEWTCDELAKAGKQVMLLVWDNATWHKSQAVRQWIRAHNHRVKPEGGVRILACLLPVKSPWLNPIEPRWVHGKRAVVEANRVLTVHEVTSRVCEYFGCEQTAHLKQHVP